MAKIQNLVIEQGTTFSQDIYVDSATGLDYNLSGYSVRSQMRKSHTSSTAIDFTATISDPVTDGILNIALTATQTAAIRSGRYVYDVEIENANGVIRVCEGIITVTPEVTRV